MALSDFKHDEIEHLKYTDVDIKVIQQMKFMINSIPDNRWLDVEKFRDYCYEYFNLPMVTIKRCIFKLQNETK